MVSLRERYESGKVRLQDMSPKERVALSTYYNAKRKENVQKNNSGGKEGEVYEKLLEDYKQQGLSYDSDRVQSLVDPGNVTLRISGVREQSRDASPGFEKEVRNVTKKEGVVQPQPNVVNVTNNMTNSAVIPSDVSDWGVNLLNSGVLQ